MRDSVTVAIPTLNAGPEFARTLAAVRAQRLDREMQLLICDSESNDETVSRARHGGAEVVQIPRASFSHGDTRNLLMARAHGTHVAFLTQDAVPASDQWLARLLSAFDLAEDIGLAFGPYQPRPDASLSVARELTDWFGSFSTTGPRIDRLGPRQRDLPARDLLGHLGFFTDANGCVARAAWERVPFRPVPYAEDHLLAHDMLRAGFAKVYVPDAAVIHSHEYTPWQWLRRSFDEARAIREVYGWAPGPRTVSRNFRGNLAADWRLTRAEGGRRGGCARIGAFAAAAAHHGARASGELLGARADRLPATLVARLSLEGRR